MADPKSIRENRRVRSPARRQRRMLRLAFLVVASLPLAACVLVIGDLPDPVDNRPDSSAESGGTSGGTNAVGGVGGTIASGGTSGSVAGGQNSKAGTGGSAGSVASGGTTSGSGGGSAGTTAEGGIGGTDVNVGGACGNCDCDDDKDLSTRCGGKDCDDNNPDVKSTQTGFFAVERPSGGYDYNCSGDYERDPTQPLKACGLLNCGTSDFGYLQTDFPPCGQPGNWGTCKPGTVCSNDVRSTTEKARCH